MSEQRTFVMVVNDAKQTVTSRERVVTEMNRVWLLNSALQWSFARAQTTPFVAVTACEWAVSSEIVQGLRRLLKLRDSQHTAAVSDLQACAGISPA